MLKQHPGLIVSCYHSNHQPPAPRENQPEPLIDHACEFREVIYLTGVVLLSPITCPELHLRDTGSVCP